MYLDFRLSLSKPKYRNAEEDLDIQREFWSWGDCGQKDGLWSQTDVRLSAVSAADQQWDLVQVNSPRIK